MQRAVVNSLYEIAQKDKNVVWLSADNGTDYDAWFYNDLPNQYFNFGIAEGNMVGAAAGMASCGKIPFVFTGGSFLAYRCCEFIRVDACFQNQNVKFIGFGSGTSISMLGATHHSTEDLSVLRAMPNLTILSPASPLEAQKVIKAAYEIKGPVYIRLGMTGEKEIYESDYDFEVGKDIVIKEGNDITIISTGSIIEEVLKATELLNEKGISTTVINAHTIKPFDASSILEASKETNYLFTVEEHNIIGGLGSCVAEVLAESDEKIKFKRIGLDDSFAKGYGKQMDLRIKNNLDGESIFNKIQSFLSERI